MYIYIYIYINVHVHVGKTTTPASGDTCPVMRIIRVLTREGTERNRPIKKDTAPLRMMHARSLSAVNC